MDAFRYAVSLRIHHPDVDPGAISDRLGLAPRAAWKAGDARSARDGTALGGRHDSTYWTSPLGQGPGDGLEEALEAFTSRLAPQGDFFRELHATGGRIEYFVGWFSETNCGVILGCRLLQALADLRIDLALDIYPRREPPVRSER